MAWPLSQDYNEAIQAPESSFSDAELKAGEAVTNALGMPMPRSGNFADVYEFNTPATKGKWAIKCFTRHVLGLRERYTEISASLLTAKLPFAVEFQYLVQGIRIKGDWFPILKMRWVEGLLLNELVKENLEKPAVLGQLSVIWCRMAKRLREADIAHADLQHGNVILVPGSKAGSLAVKLIDYDGMFVSALASKKSGEVGHPNYQHPQRLREGIYNPEVDRFPLLVVATALRALSVVGKELWTRYDNGDNLLFRESDLKDPGKSALFAELHKIDDPQVRMLTEELHKAAERDLAETPKVDELLPEQKTTKPASPIAAGKPPVDVKPEEAVPVEAVEDEAAPPSAFADVDRAEPKPKAKPAKSGVPMWALAGGGLAVVGLILAVGIVGIAAYVMTRGGGGNVVQGKDDAKEKKKDGGRDEKKDKINKDKIDNQVDPDKRFPAAIPANTAAVWRVEKNELVQSAVVPDVSIYFGDRKWTDYDFTVDARLTENTDGFAMWFRRADEQNAYIYAVGPFGNTKHVVHSINNGNWIDHATKDIKNEPVKTGQWYTAKLSIRGANGTAYLDGVKQFDFKIDQRNFGGVGLRTWNAACRFKNIRVTAPDGTVLLEGLPELPPPVELKLVRADLFGVWDHTGGGGNVAITLHPSGKFDEPKGQGTWSLDGATLTLRWPNAGAPGGVWIDTCTVSKDGKTYQGANQAGRPVNGKKIGPLPAPGDVVAFAMKGKVDPEFITEIQNGSRPQLSADGQFVAYSINRLGLFAFREGPQFNKEFHINVTDTTSIIEPARSFPDGKRMIFIADVKGLPKLLIWNWESRQVTALSTFKKAQTVVISPNMKYVLAYMTQPIPDAEHWVGLYELATKKEIKRWQSDKSLDVFGFSPDSTKAFFGKAKDAKVSAYSVTDGEPAEFAFAPREPWHAFSPDFSRVVSSENPWSLKIAQLDNGQAISTIKPPDPKIHLHGPALAPNNKLLLVGIDDMANRPDKNGRGALLDIQSGDVISVTDPFPNIPYRTQLAANGIAVLDGQNVKPRIYRFPTEPPVIPVANAEGFVPLFNGKDLAGLRTHLRVPGTWRVENGILMGTGSDSDYLYAPRDDYKDFHLRLEARISKGAICELNFRNEWNSIKEKPGFGEFTGYRAIIASEDQRLGKVGSLHVWGDRTKPVSALATEGPVAADEWFTLEVIAIGNRLTTKINGKTTATYLEPEKRFLTGHIFFRHIIPGGLVEFRKIEINEFDRPRPIAAGAPPARPANVNGVGIDVEIDFAKSPVRRREMGKTFDIAQSWALGLDAFLVNANGPDRLLFMWGDDRPGRDAIFLRQKGNTFSASVGDTAASVQHSLRPPIAPTMVGRWVPIVFSYNASTKETEIYLDGKLALRDKCPFVPKLDMPMPVWIGGGNAKFQRFNGRIRSLWLANIPTGAAPVLPVANAEGFVPLFNGKDLTGWKQNANQPGYWRVEDGHIVGTGPNFGDLYTLRDDYRDFHLRMEMRVNAGAVNLVYVRAPGEPKPGQPRDGLAAHISTAQIDQTKTGTLHLFKAPLAAQRFLKQEGPIKADQWFTLEMIAKGEMITVMIDGKTTATLTTNFKELAVGRIILAGAIPATRMEFRKIEMKETGVAAPVANAEGFLPLFNGKDLTGWTKGPGQTGDWHVKDGFLTSTLDTKKPGPGFLFTERNDFKDYHLRVEARLTGTVANGNILFRVAPDQRSYATVVNNVDGETGTLHVLAVSNGKGVKVAPGEWCVLDVIAVGKKITIKVDGKVTADFTDDVNDFRVGKIGLLRSNGTIEVRKIEIKFLNPDAGPPLANAEGFEPLFNGKDLTGWKSEAKHAGDWKAANGNLIGSAKGASALVTTRDDYKDFHLRLEARYQPGCECLVFTRAPANPTMTKGKVGHNVFIKDAMNALDKSTGSLQRTAPNGMGTYSPITQPKVSPSRPDEWFVLEMIVNGDNTTVKVNGAVTAQLAGDKNGYVKSGLIALYLAPWSKGTIEFKKIEIKELNVAAAPPFVAAEGFVALFNGKNFAGWKMDKDSAPWRSDKGVLTAGGGGILHTVRDDFKDFQLRLEARINDVDAEGGILFRRTPMSHGCEMTFNTKNAGVIMAKGKAFTQNNGTGVPLNVGDWIPIDILVEGDRMTTKINGKMTAVYVGGRDDFPTGWIGLKHSAKGSIEFRNIEIKETKAEAAPPVAGEFVQLFDGKSLNDWNVYPGSGWQVVQGVLTGTGGSKGMLYSKRNDYKDFHLRVETRFGANSRNDAVAFRTPPDMLGYEVTINRQYSDGVFTGGLTARSKNKSASFGGKPIAVPAGEWCTIEAIVQGNHFVIKVNGKVTQDYIDKDETFKSGHIAVRQGIKSAIEFKKIEIKELKPEKVGKVDNPPPAKGGFVSLFNGADLTGWKALAKDPGDWKVVDGILTGSGKKGAIATIRDDYKDFHLRVEARIAPGTDGKFAVRAVPDDTLKQTFKWQYWNAIMRDTPNGGYKLGSLTSQGPNGVGFAAPTSKPDVVKSGDWFTMDVIAIGHRVSVKVNGVDGVSWLDDKKQLPLSGQILLHLVNPTGMMEFRKIEIKEFNVKKKGAAAAPEEKKPPADVPEIAGDGFELLFNGKDMNSWKRSKQSAFWRIQDGILTGGGQGAYDLASVRDDYGDFHVRAEARISDDGLGGFYFRAQFDPADLNPKRHGYFARINSNNKELYKTGSLNAFYDGSVRNLFVKETLVPPGKWFTLEIIANGDRISAKVDGKVTKSFTDTKPLPKGRFILTSMPQSLMEFRKIEIKDLAAERVHHRKIVNKNSGKVIGVFGAVTTDGGALVQWEFVNTPNSNQNWMVVPIDKDWCRLVNVASGTCLSILGDDPKAGTRLVIWKQVDAAMSQQWKIVPIEDKEAGWVKFVNRGSGKVIAVTSAGKRDGNALEIADDTGAPEQHWKLEKLE